MPWLIYRLIFRNCMGIALVIFAPVICFADDSASYGHGKSLGQSLIKGPSSVNPNNTPFFAGDNVSETRYKENFHKMGDDATRKTHDPENQEGAAVLNSQRERLEHGFRITKDNPIIRLSNEINRDPASVVGGVEERVGDEGVKSVVETTHVCEESAEPATYTCEQTRHIRLTPPKIKEIKLRFRYWGMYGGSVTKRLLTGSRCIGSNYWGNLLDPLPSKFKNRVISVITSNLSGHTNYYVHYNPFVKRISTAIIRCRGYLTQENVVETIENPCEGYENQCNKGLCVYGNQEIIEGPGTREFCDGDDCISITRKWWRRRLTYHCKHPSKDNCGAFRSAGCDQIRAVCLERIDGVCVKHQKTFLCKTESLGNGKFRFSGDVPFCMDGNCDSHSWTSNKDFADAMAKMSVLREIGKQLKGKSLTVFGGNVKQCTKAFGGFQDCCGSGGWGSSLSLGQDCSDQERLLKKERVAKKCVRVGTYCCEKAAFGICLRKKTSFCCFPNKLSRIVQEQGRAQLGIGWGDAESPNCRALSIDELKRIDFSKIDFSSLFEDILKKTNISTVTNAASGLGDGWQAKVSAAQMRPSQKITARKLNEQEGKTDVSL